MQKSVVILRHGKSRHGPEFDSDFERPLATRGEKAAKRMARHLIERGFVPDLIVTSPAKRALDTARRVEQKVGDCPMQLEGEIYSGDVLDVVAIMRSLPEGSDVVLIVGHNPTLELLTDYLGGTVGSVMKTCSAALLDGGPSAWEGVGPGTFRLRDLVHPKQLP